MSNNRLFAILPQVSRSFAYIISKLTSPLRGVVCIAYLLFRIADTIEDAQASLAVKQKLFSLFRGLLQAGSLDTALFHDFSRTKEKLAGISAQEQLLLQEGHHVLQAFYAQQQKTRDVLYYWLNESMTGMQAYLTRDIATWSDLDDYCYYVAGTVGFMLTALFDHQDLLAAQTQPLAFKKQVLHFALALQKVNITRDIAADMAQGRRFWPQVIRPGNRITIQALNQMVENTLVSVQAGHGYVLAITHKAPDVRFFCIFSLFLALKTLRLLAGNPACLQQNIKTRKSTFYCTLLLARLAARLPNRCYTFLIGRYAKQVAVRLARGRA